MQVLVDACKSVYESVQVHVSVCESVCVQKTCALNFKKDFLIKFPLSSIFYSLDEVETGCIVKLRLRRCSINFNSTGVPNND